MTLTQASQPVIQFAEEQHLVGAKQLSDLHKNELGFVNRAILKKAIAAHELLVALYPEPPNEAEHKIDIAGFAHFYLRRDSIMTLYSIVVNREYQGKGLGRQLFGALINEARERGKNQIYLKCPSELPANLFYERLGLEILRVDEGKHRPLNVWVYSIKTS